MKRVRMGLSRPSYVIRTGWTHFWRQLRKVATNPVFLVLTVLGNTMLFLCAAVFCTFERGINQNVRGFGDALWWAFTTISTLGYGDVVPHSLGGRIVTVVLVLTAGVLFFSFIALLSSAFVEVEFLELEQDVESLRCRLEKALENREQRP